MERNDEEATDREREGVKEGVKGGPGGGTIDC